MAGFTQSAIGVPIHWALPLAAVGSMPLVILVLCVVAGIGTVLLLPGRGPAALRRAGGLLLGVAALIGAASIVRWAAGKPSDTGVYFWIFSAIAVIGAVRVVTHPRPVYSALYFVLSVMASAGLFILLGAEFMAAALVLIYAGAILITYVFVIMLAAQSMPAEADASGKLVGGAEYDRISREPVAASAMGFALMGVLLFVIFAKGQALAAPKAPRALPAAQAGVDENNLPAPAAHAGVSAAITPGSVQDLGLWLFNHQLVNLELAGILLTVSMVGAIIIARRRVESTGEIVETEEETVVGPATPINDNPHSIPVYGTTNPRQKEYPET